jgi:hypothetical protein
MCTEKVWHGNLFLKQSDKDDNEDQILSNYLF